MEKPALRRGANLTVVIKKSGGGVYGSELEPALYLTGANASDVGSVSRRQQGKGGVDTFVGNQHVVDRVWKRKHRPRTKKEIANDPIRNRGTVVSETSTNIPVSVGREKSSNKVVSCIRDDEHFPCPGSPYLNGRSEVAMTEKDIDVLCRNNPEIYGPTDFYNGSSQVAITPQGEELLQKNMENMAYSCLVW